MTNRSRRSRQLSFEALETRMLLAGNVQVILIGDQLLVSGDKRANQLVVDGSTGEATGLNGTLINGRSGPVELPFGADINSVVINLKGGSDSIDIFGDGLRLPGFVNLSAGAGNDRVLIRDLIISGSVTVNMGAGNDTLVVDDAEFRGPVSVLLGAGSDALSVEQNASTSAFSEFLGSVSIQCGAGNDVIRAGQDSLNTLALFRSTVAADGGRGSDTWDPIDAVFDVTPTLLKIETIAS